MQQFLATLFLVIPLMALFMWLYSRRHTPRLRIHREDFQDLLEDALAGRARLERWELMTGIIARYDEDLMRWQASCRNLAEGRDYEVVRTPAGPVCRFRDDALGQLRRILQEMSLQTDTDRRRL